MTTNITIRIDEETAREAKVLAAKRDTTCSGNRPGTVASFTIVKAFVDTYVLVYAHDRGAGRHDATRQPAKDYLAWECVVSGAIQWLVH